MRKNQNMQQEVFHDSAMFVIVSMEQLTQGKRKTKQNNETLRNRVNIQLTFYQEHQNGT